MVKDSFPLPPGSKDVRGSGGLEKRSGGEYLAGVENLVRASELPLRVIDVRVGEESQPRHFGIDRRPRRVAIQNVEGGACISLLSEDAYHREVWRPTEDVEKFLQAEREISPERNRLLPRVEKLITEMNKIPRPLGHEYLPRPIEYGVSNAMFSKLQGDINLGSSHALSFNGKKYLWNQKGIDELELALTTQHVFLYDRLER